MTRVLFLDPWSGIAGDMLIAALLDLEQSAPPRRRGGLGEQNGACGFLSGLTEALYDAIDRLGLNDVEIAVKRVSESGLRATQIDVRGSLSPSEGASSRAPLFPQEAVKLISQSSLPAAVKERSLAALQRLLEVEATIHGVSLHEVHLHELDAVDTIVDVVGAFTLWHALGEPRVVCGPLPLGSGKINTAHGCLGVPAPATVELCRGIPVVAGEEHVEVTTPTGALLVSELACAFGPLPSMRVLGVGYGAGHRRLEHGPNVVRAILGEAVSNQHVASGHYFASPEHDFPLAAWDEPIQEMVTVIETQIDDATGERMAHLHKLLLEAGALDVWLRPVIMKKGRPGTELVVLAEPEKEQAMVDLIFRESGSLGLRRRLSERLCLARDVITVDVKGVPVRVKRGWWQGRPLTVAPEYEDAAAAAAELGMSLEEVMSQAAAAARGHL